MYEPFPHKRTLVVLGVSGVGCCNVFSCLQWKYGNGQSAPCHEVLIQTRIDKLISTLQQFQGCKLVLINDSQLSNTAGSKVGNVAYNITGFKEHVLKYLAQYGVQYILKMYRIS